MASEQTNSAQRLQIALERPGLGLRVEILPSSTRSAQEAAQAIGCSVSQIAKSVIFQTKNSNRPVLALVSGSNRVDECILAQQVGEPVRKGDADFVRQMTGYAIGGIPPTGHTQQIETYIDRDLKVHEEIWAAAGTPHAVFILTSEVLIQITGGIVLQFTC